MVFLEKDMDMQQTGRRGQDVRQQEKTGHEKGGATSHSSLQSAGSWDRAGHVSGSNISLSLSASSPTHLLTTSLPYILFLAMSVVVFVLPSTAYLPLTVLHASSLLNMGRKDNMACAHAAQHGTRLIS